MFSAQLTTLWYCPTNWLVGLIWTFPLIRDNIAMRRGCAWLKKRVLDWMNEFIDTLYPPLGTTSNYSAIADLHTSEFTVTHALGLSVFTSRILATDLEQSHCHFKSHMQSSFHSLLPFLLLFCSCRLNSISLLPSSYSGRLASRNLTRLRHINWTPIYNHFALTTQKTQPFYCWEVVFTAPLHRNGSNSIVACVFVVAGMCLPIRCVAMNVCFDFTITAFGRHATIF
jgi:hypothetical protein